MLSTTIYSRGNVVLARFIFTDESGARRRPVVVLSTEDYQLGRQEIIVAGITTNVDRLLIGDYLISDWQIAGLLFPSVVTGVIRTIKQSMIQRQLGSMSSRDMDAVEDNLRVILELV